MNPGSESPLCVQILAPTGRDSEVLVDTVSAAGMVAAACPTMAELAARMTEGAGAAVLASEALTSEGVATLGRALDQQPEWSDFPLVIMESLHRGRRADAARDYAASLSYATVLVRPVHAHTLVSALRSALRSRARQYQVRDELAERKRVEEALRDANDRKDEFLAMLGHELRNPLSAIRNATDLIAHVAPDNDLLRRAHGVLARQSTHMTGLVDGLLEVSRIARGKIHLDCETLDVCELIDGVLQDRSVQFEAQRLTVQVDGPGQPLHVWGDRVRLVQVFDNLLGNAIKFTRPGDTIHVTLGGEDGCVLVQVKDTGVGIRAEMLPRLFDPFQQETQGIARAAGGLGLGLALARGLVELHHGSISAYSDGLETGAAFQVRLPMSVSEARDEPSAQVSAAARRRVLIVEDNRDAGEMLRDLLELLGHDAKLVGSGPEALDTLHEEGADLVLCDLGLPGMSGYDLVRAVRRDAALRATPLIAVTGYGQPEDRRRTCDAGFDEHLTKPVDLAALNAVLVMLQ